MNDFTDYCDCIKKFSCKKDLKKDVSKDATNVAEEISFNKFDNDKTIKQSKVVSSLFEQEGQKSFSKSLSNTRDTIKENKMDINEQNKSVCEKLADERDFYKQEYFRLSDSCKQTQENTKQETASMWCKQCVQLKEEICFLRQNNEVLIRENHDLLLKMDRCGIVPKEKFCKTKRLERENELLRTDVQRLEEECDCLREGVKILNENKLQDYVKFKEANTQNENLIKKLKSERHELMTSQGSHKATLVCLEDKVNMYQELLRTTNEELNCQKNMYFQLRHLHEQTDKALLDTQEKLNQAEAKLAVYQQRANFQQRGTKSFSEYKDLKIKTNHEDPRESFGNAEKEDLLVLINSKTEKISSLKDELSEKDNIIREKSQQLEMTISQLRNLEKASKQFENLKVQSKFDILDAQKFNEILEAKEVQANNLKNEVEYLSKENMSLQTSYHEMKNNQIQSKQQVSVALQAVDNLESKMKEVSKAKDKLERQIAELTNSLVKYQDLVRNKDMAIESLSRSNQEFDSKIKNLKKTYSRMDEEKHLSASQLNTIQMENRFLKVEKEKLKNALKRCKEKVKLLEDKLFKCICDICDNVRDKCYLGECIFTSPRETTPKSEDEQKVAEVSSGEHGILNEKQDTRILKNWTPGPSKSNEITNYSEKQKDRSKSLTNELFGSLLNAGVPQILTCTTDSRPPLLSKENKRDNFIEFNSMKQNDQQFGRNQTQSDAHNLFRENEFNSYQNSAQNQRLSCDENASGFNNDIEQRKRWQYPTLKSNTYQYSIPKVVSPTYMTSYKRNNNPKTAFISLVDSKEISK